jgi:hypothetical protein
VGTFIKRHWLGLLLVLGVIIALALDPVRNVLVAGLAGAGAVFSFIERLLSSGKGAIGQPNSGPAKQIDDDLATLQSRGASAERVTEEALRIMASGKGKDSQ